MQPNKTDQSFGSESDETPELSGEAAARCFLTQIHQGCAGRLEIRTINPQTRVVASYWPNTVEDAVAITINTRASENVYFGVCTRRDTRSGKKENLSHFPGLWADLDFKDFTGGEADVCAKLKSFPLQPTVLLHTGGGAHAYWLLTVPIAITPDRIGQLESLNAGFAKILGGDRCHDLPRILRVPGTTNLPDEKKRQKGRIPEPVRLLWHDGPRYTLKQLQEVVVNPSRDNTAGEKNHSQGAPPTLPPRFLELLQHNPKIKGIWEGNRKDLKDQSRSGYDMALANQLALHEFTDDESKTILRLMPSGRGTKATDAYLNLTIGKARSASNEGKLLPVDLADQYLFDRQLQTEEGLLLRCHQQKWLRYNGKAYDQLPIPDLQADVTTYLQSSDARSKTTSSFVNNVLLNLQGRCIVPSSISLPILETQDSWIEAPNTLVMANGILDLDTLLHDPTRVRLKSHTPLLVSIIALPFAFDSSAKCPRWQAFLREILPDPASRELLCEIFGLCLTYDMSQQKFFLFEGIGANGKGVVIIILTMMLGETNVSNIPLELFGAPHGLEGTLGKLVNITSEVGELDRVAEGLLKQFTGGDWMHFNPKYKDTFSARPTAKLIITTNVRPPFRDRSEGIWRRLILLPFPISIPEPKQNKHLAEDLAGELPGIFNWALDGYRSLLKRGHFVEPEVSLTAKEEFRRESNPAATFLQEHCLPDPNAETPTGEVYFAYDCFCKGHGNKPLNDANFGKEVHRVFPEVHRVKLSGSSHSHRPYAYKGLRLLKPQMLS